MERLTKIDLQSEALNNTRARQIRGTWTAQTKVATRDARAHNLVHGLLAGQSVHIASMGELSLHDVAAALVNQYGPFDTLTLATWAASIECIQRLVQIRDAGGLGHLEAFVDVRCQTDCADAHALFRLAFDAYKTGANHAKIMAFTGGTGPGLAVVSTANLTRNPRCEVLIVTRDTALAEFHRDWIRESMHGA